MLDPTISQSSQRTLIFQVPQAPEIVLSKKILFKRTAPTKKNQKVRRSDNPPQPNPNTLTQPPRAALPLGVGWPAQMNAAGKPKKKEKKTGWLAG